MHPREGGRKRPFSEMTRRDFLRTSGMAAASIPLASAILAACGTPTGSTAGNATALARPDRPVTLPINEAGMIGDGLKPETGPLQIYNWEEYINPRVLGMFEEQYGVKVEVNTFNTMAEAIATLTSTAEPYDVFVADIDQIGRLSDSLLLRPLNHSYLGNLEQTWDRFHVDTPDQPWYDVGAHYSVPYTTYTSGVAWRVDKGGPSEEGVLAMDNVWDLLWDERWRGKIHILDDNRESIGMAMLRDGITDINTDDPATRQANLDAAQANLMSLLDTVDVKADISDYVDLPENISQIHHGWSGDFLAAKWYFPKDQVDKDVIRYWTPKEKGPVGNDILTVPSTGNNPVLAHHFLNFMLNFDNAMVNFQWNGYIPPMKALNVDDLVVGGGNSYSIVLPGVATAISNEADFAKGVTFAELSPEVDRQWHDVWEAFNAG